MYHILASFYAVFHPLPQSILACYLRYVEGRGRENSSPQKWCISSIFTLFNPSLLGKCRPPAIEGKFNSTLIFLLVARTHPLYHKRFLLLAVISFGYSIIIQICSFLVQCFSSDVPLRAASSKYSRAPFCRLRPVIFSRIPSNHSTMSPLP